MVASFEFGGTPSIGAPCEALADEIVSKIPELAETRGLPPPSVAVAVWLALFCDLVGKASEARMNELFVMARRAVAKVSAGAGGNGQHSRGLGNT
ncbi:MAG: hypothetical protein WCK65_00055 [Rhodospirillaceae bacterium]